MEKIDLYTSVADMFTKFFNVNDKYYREINKKVGNVIHINTDTINQILQLLLKKEDENKIHNDVMQDLLNGVISITNMEIHVNDDHESEFITHVVIKDNYYDIINEAKNEGKDKIIGCLLLDVLNQTVAIDIVYVVDCSECCSYSDEFCLGFGKFCLVEKRGKDIIKSNIKYIFDIAYKMASSCIVFFTTINLAMLHPVIKKAFNKTTTESRLVDNKKPKKKDKKYKKQKLVYIKCIKVTTEDINAEIEKSPYTRHTLCWYVCGHWRTYKDGRKVFIKPYWKGVLRDSKENVEEPRERKIDPEYINIDTEE